MTIVVAIWLLGSTRSAVANDTPINPAAIIKAAVAQLEREHVSRSVLDDRLSQKWFEKFLTRLDPNRMYFLKSDLRDFRRFETRLDDFAKEGEFQFPLQVRTQLRKRIKQALSFAEKSLAEKHDFSIDEDCPVRVSSYATTDAELQERWRLQIKRELLIETIHGRKRSDIQSQLLSRYKRISRQITKMSDERLCQLYLDSLAKVYDSQSAYLSPSLLKSYTQIAPVKTYQMGIGLQKRSGRFFITSMAPELGHANSNRALIGWQLIAIRRINGTTFDVVEMPSRELYHMISWPYGPLKIDAEVILELLHPVTFERQTISWNRL